MSRSPGVRLNSFYWAVLNLPLHARMTLGLLCLSPNYPHAVAFYSVSVRYVQYSALRFLQIPPRGGHPCFSLQFPSLGPVRDLHPMELRRARRTKRVDISVDPFLLPIFYKSKQVIIDYLTQVLKL